MIVIPNRVSVVAAMSALGLAVGLLTLALLASPAQAQAETTTDHVRNTFNGFVINPCTGEELFLEGTQNLVAHITRDANGGVHIKSHRNVEATAVSASGAKYVAHQTQNDELSARGDSESATTFTLTNTLQFIRQGSATPTDDDFVIKEVTHLTVNANGEITSVVAQFNEGVCM